MSGCRSRTVDLPVVHGVLIELGLDDLPETAIGHGHRSRRIIRTRKVRADSKSGLTSEGRRIEIGKFVESRMEQSLS